MNRKILLSLGVVVFVVAVATTATGAFFSDTETSTGNTFTAGDIDLQIDNESYVTNMAGVLVASPETSWAMSNLTNQLFFNFADVKPGDVGEDTISIHVGSNDAYTCMAARITATPENTLVDPETDALDVGPAGGDNGELQTFLNFRFWNDDGDNVYEVGETDITALTGPASSIFNGAWSPVGTGVITGNTTKYVAKAWCFGTLTPAPVAQGEGGPLVRGTGFTCNGSGANNIAQTDGIVVDVSFQAVQARNNGQFQCSSLPPFTGTAPVIVNVEDLVTTLGGFEGNPNGWFFYNDVNDTIMTINQFSGLGGVNDIVSGPSGVGAAQMLLDDASSRYNIATYKYKNVKLSDIGSLRYRIYDASASSQTPYLHFNVDFNNSDTWQSRLIQVPTGVAVNTWTTVDALAGTWTWSGYAKGPDGVVGGGDDNTWPIGVGAFDESIANHTWAEILAAYPNAETRSTDSFLGVRVGHPGPDGENSYVDWVEFDGQMNNFE